MHLKCMNNEFFKHREVRFARFLSGGFTTMAVLNPPERKLAKPDHAACATVPPHARPCCYSRRMRALVLMDHNFLLPPPTLVLPTAIYYKVCRLLYKIYFRFQDIGLGYICYVHPSSSQETTKHFLAIVGGLHIISYLHYF